MPTLHSHTHCQVALANTQAKAWQRVWLSNRTTKTTDKPANEKEPVFVTDDRKGVLSIPNALQS